MHCHCRCYELSARNSQKIIDGKGDYGLSLKENQPTLYEYATTYFEDVLKKPSLYPEVKTIKTVEKGHGRIETQIYYFTMKRLCRTLLTNGAKPPDEKAQHLQSILLNHSELAVCYAMKEELCALFRLTDPVAAYEGWKRWFDAAEVNGIPALMRFAPLKRSRLDGLAAHAVFPISTGKLEGFNNKIKVTKRVGYGYRDEDYFFTLIRYLAFPSSSFASLNFP